MGRTTTGQPEKFVKSSGNVFADLRLPNADELAVETELLRRIVDCLRARGLSQRQAARILGIDQPKVSALMRGRVEGFSVARMFRLLNALDMDVEILVRPKPRSRAHGRSRVAA